jgi:hypothetical protein
MPLSIVEQPIITKSAPISPKSSKSSGSISNYNSNSLTPIPVQINFPNNLPNTI